MQPQNARELAELPGPAHDGAGRESLGAQRTTQIEERGEGLGRVEVVVHRLDESLAEAGELGRYRCRRRRSRGLVLRGVVDRAPEPLERPGAVDHPLLGPLQRAPVVCAEQEEAEHGRIVPRDEVANRQRVAQRLRHLLAAQVHHAVVQPVAREGLAGDALGLGDLAFVMREDEVLAAAVDVERLTEIADGHGRALDMPARPPGSPRAVPGGLAGLRALPQREVAGVALAFVDLHASAGQEVLEVLAGKLAVGGKPANLEVDVPLHDVAVAAGDEALDHRDHLGNMLGGLGLHLRRQHAERGDVLPEGLDIPLGHLARRHAFLVGAPDDLVLDVREVPDERDAVPVKAQVAGDDVEDDHHPRVPDVGQVVHGHAARVHLDLARRERDELLLRARHGVVDLHGTSTLTTAMAAIPSLRPSRPRPSGLLAFTLTISTGTPRTSASRFAISPRRGDSRGAWARTVASTFTRRAPRAATSSIT